MDRARVLEMLAQADATVELPRMGGMARADGVVIASADHWAFAARDGSVRHGSMPQPPEVLRRGPPARGGGPPFFPPSPPLPPPPAARPRPRRRCRAPPRPP